MHGSEINKINGDQALKRLLAGNARFQEKRPEHPRQTPDRSRETAADGQRPFAVIIGCSDSRVPPDILFDQGIGYLFVVRTAGGVVDDVAIASIEYAVSHLKTPLILVLAHAHCGAVTAAAAARAPLEGRLGCLVHAIRPALEQVKEPCRDLVDRASKILAEMIARQLKNTGPFLSHAVNTGKIMIAAAYYDLFTGAVDILSR
ncbi:MAG: carbonic anhydrase [Deltaproteobacteria bacterium]|nr:carbonic anhydrase [Deltaproteobacteria bacterium]